MSNDFKVQSFILNETMRQMDVSLQFCKNLSSYDAEGRFTESPRKGETIKGRKDIRFVGRDGETFTDEGVIQRTFDITVQQTAGVDVLLTNRDLMFNVDNLTDNIAKPAAQTLAAKIEVAALAKAISAVGNSVNVPASGVTDLKIYNKARALMTWEGCPQNGHTMLITPDMSVDAVDAGKSFFTQEAEAQYDTGMLGRHSGAKVYESQVLPTHTVGPLGGTPLVDGASQGLTTWAASQTILTKGWTSGNASRLKKDDVITFAGVYAVNPTTRQSTGALRQFTVLSDFSDASGGGNVTISPAIVVSGPYQNCSGSPADSAAILTYAAVSTHQNKVTPQGLRFHKEAFVWGTLSQPVPTGAVIFAKEISHPRLPLKIRYIADWDTDNNKRKDRLDVVWFFGVAVPEWATRIAS